MGTVSVSVGPFQQMVIPDGTITGTRLPLVLISHGTGGSDGSHFDTALALGGAGFVVVALTHTGDNYLDQSYAGNQKNLTDRPRQVNVVLTYMLTNWTQQNRLDATRVGMFGFSLGGFTTLVEVGSIPDVSRMRELCRQRPTAPECLFIKQRNGDQLTPPALTTTWTHDPRVKAAVVAAPAVSYLFGPGSFKDVKIPIQLWRASNDDQVPDEWNTSLGRRELPTAPEEHFVTGAGHYGLAAKHWPDKLRRSAPTTRNSIGVRFIATSTARSLHSSRKSLLRSAYRPDCEVDSWIMSYAEVIPVNLTVDHLGVISCCSIAPHD